MGEISTAEYILGKFNVGSYAAFFWLTWTFVTSLSPVWYQTFLFFVGLGWIVIAASRPDKKEGRPSQRIFYLGLSWEIRDRFFGLYDKIENPGPRTLNDCILGPFCANCGRALIDTTIGQWDEARYIAQVCETCQKETDIKPLLGGLSLFDAKREAYVEAQRLMRQYSSLASRSKKP
jgi:hypothetical protein